LIELTVAMVYPHLRTCNQTGNAAQPPGVPVKPQPPRL
jgi:hypothetical protein